MTQKNQLFCCIRKLWVAATPEEYVRQEVLQLLSHLGFPASYISVEKDLVNLPHYSQKIPRPERRGDIICYAKNKNEELQPLLVVECKAIPLTDKEIRQVLGYNHYVQACFIALANQEERRLGWYDQNIQEYKFIPYFPTYEQLIKSIKTHDLHQ